MGTAIDRIAKAKADRADARKKIAPDQKLVEALYEIVEVLHDIKNMPR